MKCEIKVFGKFSSVKHYWDRIIKDNAEMTVYQTVEWNQHIAFSYSTNNYLLKNIKSKYYVLFEDGEAKIIAPLAIPNNDSEYISIKGQYSKAGALNLIYSSDVKKEDFDYLLEYVFNTTSNDELGFYEIPSYTFFHKYLEEHSDAKFLFGETCVRCHVPQSYDEYYNLLSKSSRQTIRTAHNRVKTDNKNLSFDFYLNGKNIPLKAAVQIKDLVLKREAEINGNEQASFDNSTNIKSIIDIIRDPIYRFSMHEKNSFCATLLIDGVLAAAVIAMESKGNIIVPSFAHNSSLDRYYPGVLLIDEIFKHICGKKYGTFDLSRGNERYKYRYLCSPEEYTADHFKIKRPI